MNPIRLDNVSVAYDHTVAVQGVTGAFMPGSLTAITGPNGAGKSTLLKAVMGEVPLKAGSIDRGGRSISDFAYLPQITGADRRFPLSVEDVVLLGAWKRTGALRGVPTAEIDAAHQALATVGLDGFARRQLGALSVGQLQRVLFARLLLQDADVILLDEPFAAIDVRTCEDLLALVHRWHEQERTIIAVLHDAEQIRVHFPQTLMLARDIVAWGSTEQLVPVSPVFRGAVRPLTEPQREARSA